MTPENLISFASGAALLWAAQGFLRCCRRLLHRRAARLLNHRCGTILHRV
jgi:hypothetical protein